MNNWVVKHHAPQSPVYLSGGVPDYQYSLDSPRKKEKISAGVFWGSEYEVRVEKKKGKAKEVKGKIKRLLTEVEQNK